MNILLISQCDKRALTQTRRILDQFAERRGDRTWQTAITQAGLATLRKLLRQSARRNTAVACHWIRGRDHSELLWVVGNSSRFNEQGAVPTNTTERDILDSQRENSWHTLEDISLLSSIAALFHDFGKANLLFQNKLRGKGKLQEPLRHEWVSLCMFCAFVGNNDDHEWLTKLGQVSEIAEQLNQEVLDKIQQGAGQFIGSSPFQKLPPLAQTIGWLILTHHRMPKTLEDKPQSLKHIDHYLHRLLAAYWNSPQYSQKEWSEKELLHVWQCPKGTPFLSRTWQLKASLIAKRALGRANLQTTTWLQDRFSLHLSRLALMLADHTYSSQAAAKQYWDKSYSVYANTRDEALNQRLDEHLVGVYRSAHQFVRLLPALRQSLAAITRHPLLKKRTPRRDFVWQNTAYDLACGVRTQATENGFFGINMASTGKGKTLANARIMYGLSDEKLGCRFTVALGLRTLTLQTGSAFREQLQLEHDDLAVLVGSQAVSQLYRLRQEQNAEEEEAKADRVKGSESANNLLDPSHYVSFQGSTDSPLNKWLARDSRLNRLVNAPVLVSTIDHLVPATESERGGKQIAPMLRLLTSDLILDEPDDFDMADLPALCRLVNWAGMLGSKVLLSSATLPPSLVEALFRAYYHGRIIYEQSCGQPGKSTNICCAWFDEHGASHGAHADIEFFTQQHQQFVSQRVQSLSQIRPKRIADYIVIDPPGTSVHDVLDALTEQIYTHIHALHDAHAECTPAEQSSASGSVSLGIVRVANIRPLVSLAQRLLAKPAKPGYQIHYCIYHSQLTLIQRSHIESVLDQVFDRRNYLSLWECPSIQEAIAKHPTDKHVFVVLASPVCEVGRDWSAHWAISEPSSVRALIQLAGRVLRHQDQEQYPSAPNILLFNKNINALLGRSPAYSRPGFESNDVRLQHQDLREVLPLEQITPLTANPRIQERVALHPQTSLTDLEHAQLRSRLLADTQTLTQELIHPVAARWWAQHADWTYELQRRTPFRKSAPQTDYYHWLEDEDSEPRFYRWHLGVTGEAQYMFEITPVPICATGNHLWAHADYAMLLRELADHLEKSVDEVSRTFGTITLRDMATPWSYNSVLGGYRPLE
ncbi:type I-F CRISPR-associated helicase Cas3f [Pokkaliibacter sp. MBI-7]|uniref:type I-F CRISPR-associated helicase Cas3f n=1 Tax=Pokkaliibacter sp. MBI-7 TaxID=3040600 RepID=UPI00244A35A0|nr:type I-F CRISPR-associated helicase Cas3f [Pokkaliibacter sp. MBI-7]MDH2434355.1 type I-F CRISPR-associated helicase Cas3f [Pokkaliibacter sp. MBI-7]